MSKSPRRLLTAIALLTAIGCGGGDENGPEGSISLSASPTSLTVQQGGSGTVTVTLVRAGGFADPVNVAVTGLPSGVTLSVTPAQLTGTTTSAVVNVTVANTVAAGTYTANVTATAAGVGTASTTYSLTVTALPTFSLTSTPAALSIGQGGSSTTNIGVVRTNFTGAVALTLVSPPAGITGSFNPTPATADLSVLTINVAGTVATGNYTLTVNGSSAGQTDKTATVTLTVTPPPDYTISATPATVPINAGSNATTTVNITRTNFTGAVNLALDAPPAGITATFNPASPTGNSSVATINVASTVAVGNYNVTIKGTATGVPTNVAEAVDEASAAGDRTTVVVVQVALAPNFTIAAPAVSTTPGGTANSTVTIVRTNLTGDVVLSLVSPPAGITGVFTPATLTGATLTSTLAITVAGTVAPGSYNVTVQGVGGGLTKTVVVAVTVATGPSVTFSMTPASLNLQQGTTGSATLNAARSNFTGNITPTVTGGTNGLTATVTPNPITGNTATVNVSVGAGVAPGSYTFTIAGNTGGTAGTPTTTLGVTVTQATGNNYTWEFCDVNSTPTKFWRLSGGTWAEVTPTVVGTVTRFSFTLATGSAGIAYTAAGSGFASTIVYFAQSTELGSFVGACNTTATVQKTFNISNQIGGEAGQLGYGNTATPTTSAVSTYNLNVIPGTYDWLWAFGSQSGFPPSTTFTNYRIGRNEVAVGGAVGTSRTGAPAFVTAPFSFTGGSAGGFWQTLQSLQGANGFVGSMTLGSIPFATGSGNMLFLQPGDRLSTDLWLLGATHLEFDQNGKGDTRSSSRYIGSAPPASLTFALPGKVPAFTVSTVAGASVPWAAAGSIPAEFTDATSSVSATFQGAGSNAIVSLIATRGWLVANAMSTSFTLTGPTLPNFLPAWAPGSPLAGTTVSMTGSNLTTGPVAGGFLNTSIRIQ